MTRIRNVVLQCLVLGVVAVRASPEERGALVHDDLRQESFREDNDISSEQLEEAKRRVLQAGTTFTIFGEEEPAPAPAPADDPSQQQQGEEGGIGDGGEIVGELGIGDEEDGGVDITKVSHFMFATPNPTSAPMPGDFQQLNELFRTAVLTLPDTDIQEQLLFQLLQIALRNMECSNLGFDDLKITPELRNQQEAGLDFGLVNFGLQCDFDFQWSYIFLVGNGHATVRIGESSAHGGMDFFSNDFTEYPPASAQVTSCSTDIKILGLDFSGNIASEIFNLFSQLIVDTMNGLLNDVICGEMKETGAELIGEGLDYLFELMSPYLEPAESWRYNVTYPEATMPIPDDADLISWNDDTGFGEFMMAAMDEIELVFGSLMEDPNQTETLYWPNGTAYPEGYDLGINVLLREYMLDSDRSLSVNLSDLAAMNESAVLVENHDQLTETNITLLEMKVYGLDTFTVMQPFQRFGNFTLQNALSWEYLHFEATILMEMQASSLEDSLIKDYGRVEPYLEEFHVSLGVEDIETVISILVALNPQRMKELQVGSLIDVASAVPCLLASLHEVTVSGLNITVGNIRTPTASGLVSPGVDRLVKDGIEFGVFMYKGTILKMIPTLFATTVRDMVSEFLEDFECPELNLPPKDEFIDLRDLLLDADDAEEAGATGLSPYGDLTSTIYGIGQGMWEEVEEDGSLGLNSLVIEPVTEAISGIPGKFEIAGTLFNFTTNEENQMEFQDLVDRFEVVIFDLVVDNLNTVVHPMAVIQPVNHPYITQSTINMGPMEDAPINASISVLMSLEIEDSPLAQDNIVTFGMSVASIEVFVEALTMLSQNNFLNYRMGDGFKPSCWLSVITPPKLNSAGYRVEGAMDQGVEMRRFLAKVADLQLHIDCVQCSPGLDSLPNMVDIFDRTKVTQILSYRIPLFAEEIAISEAMQVGFDRWLVDAPYACPHRPEYDENYERPESWETVEFTQLSVEASDTIFFTASVAAELAFVLLVETHYPWELDTLAPLSGQNNFVAPEGTDIFNFTNVTETFDNMANDVRDYLGEPQLDRETKQEDLGVNLMMRDFANGTDGWIDLVELISDEPIDVSVEGMVFLFHSVKIRGLDSFTRFDIMKPIADQTLLNSMHLRNLELNVSISTGSRTNPPQIITFNFKAEDINATVPIFAAIDLNVLKSLELGHFMLGGYVIDCLLSSAIDIHFPQLLLELGSLSAPTFDGFLPDSGKALKESVEEVFDTYGNRSLKALPIMFDHTLRTFINTFIKDYTRDKANCTHIEDYTETITAEGDEPYPFTGFIDFRDLLLPNENSSALGGRGLPTYGDLARTLIGPIHDEILWVDPETGLSTLNEFLGPLGEIVSGEEGTIVIPGSMLPQIPTWNWEMGSPANVTTAIGDLTFEGIDTIGAPLALLMPIYMRPHQVRNSAGLGMGGKPISVSLRIMIELVQWNEEETEIVGTTVNDMVIKLSMENATGLMDAMALISENATIHFPMKDVFNPFCWLSLVPAPKLNEFGIKEEGERSYISLTDVEVNVAKLNLTVECLECGSMGAKNLVDAVSSPGAVEALTNVANDALNLGETIALGNLVQDNLDRVFNEVSRYCPHHPDYVEDIDLLGDILDFKPLDFSTSVGVNSLVYLLSGVVFCLVIGISVITTLIKWIVNRRHQKWLRTLPVPKVHIIQHLQSADDQLERELNEHTSAMITTKEIPAWIRWFMPVIIIGNCAMFLSGHLNVAADVAMTIVISGEEVPMDQFYSFSVIDSTIQMWEAGMIEMAIFLLTFSGLWPYTKQIMSLICWVAPPRRISISTRGNTYLWLDILAKWSMIDIFVILLYMISFRVKAKTPDLAFLPTNFFALEFYIIPRWGIYANLIAQMISQISSHFIIYYHRAIVRRATREYEVRHAVMLKDKKVESGDSVETTEVSEDLSDGEGTEKVRLCDGAFARPHKGESSKLISRQIASYGLVVVTFLLIVFLILGGSLTFMSVEIQGVMSYISGDNAFNEFNVFDIAVLLYNDSVALGGFNNIGGHLLLGGVLILTVFLAPILQAVLLAIHWFRPMDDKQRRKLAGFIEVLSAWQYAEVFILATLVCSWQQGQTSEGVMYEACADFNEVFRMLAYYGILEREKAHCFRVEATILTGAYFLLAGTVLLALLNSFVMKASFHHFWDKECIRKEEAMDEHLTFEEAKSPVDEETYNEIRPPPVLFTDTFRWLLRPEHLGDRPLKTEQPLKGHLLLEDGVDAFDDVEKLSSASSSASWQQKSIEDSITKSVDDTKSADITTSADDSASLDVEGVAAKTVDVDDLMASNHTMQASEGTVVNC